VARHAGATHSTVFLDWTSAHLRVIVEDNGHGFEPAIADQERKLGLYGMKERASLIGGDLQIESEVGVGTTIVAHIPGSAVMPLAQVVPAEGNIKEITQC
jgi:two-component system sensor histidine kinase DegS